jgi:hypothetical protein
LNPQTYKIRHFFLTGAEDGGFIGFIGKRPQNHRNERLKGENEALSVYKSKFHSRNPIDYGIFLCKASEKDEKLFSSTLFNF